MLSPLKTNPFEQTARSSGSNFPIMPSFDRVSRGYTKKKKKNTRTHTHTHRGEKGTKKREEKFILKWRCPRRCYTSNSGVLVRGSTSEFWLTASQLQKDRKRSGVEREKRERGGGEERKEKSGTRVSIIVIPVRCGCVLVYAGARADRDQCTYAYTVRSRVWCVFA